MLKVQIFNNKFYTTFAVKLIAHGHETVLKNWGHTSQKLVPVFEQDSMIMR